MAVPNRNQKQIYKKSLQNIKGFQNRLLLASLAINYCNYFDFLLITSIAEKLHEIIKTYF